MNVTVSVVTPCWNGLELLKKNLPLILSLEGVSEWIISDDGSTDGSVQWVKENYPQVTIVARSKNEGFPKNVNTGAKIAKGEFIAIINQDLSPHRDAVTYTLPHFKNPKVAGVTFCETGERGWGKVEWIHGWIETPYSQSDSSKAHESFWGSGGETIYRRDVWENLNGYDEIFSPGYWEDIDLGYRLRKRGFTIMWEPRAIVESAKRGGSFSKRWQEDTLVRIKERNRLLTIWKNVTSDRLFREHLSAVARRTVSHPGYSRVVLDALSLFSQVKSRRELEKKEAVLTDEEVFDQFPKS
jgi:GT2 family glycosyltransferase